MGMGKCVGELSVDQTAHRIDQTSQPTLAYAGGSPPSCHLDLQSGGLALPKFFTLTFAICCGFRSRFGPSRKL